MVEPVVGEKALRRAEVQIRKQGASKGGRQKRSEAGVTISNHEQ